MALWVNGAVTITKRLFLSLFSLNRNLDHAWLVVATGRDHQMAVGRDHLGNSHLVVATSHDPPFPFQRWVAMNGMDVTVVVATSKACPWPNVPFTESKNPTFLTSHLKKSEVSKKASTPFISLSNCPTLSPLDFVRVLCQRQCNPSTYKRKVQNDIWHCHFSYCAHLEIWIFSKWFFFRHK